MARIFRELESTRPWKLASTLALVLASVSIALSIWNTNRRNSDAEMASPRLSIADLVREVKTQIRITQDDVNKKNIKHLFYTRQLDLELNFVVKESIGGEGEIELGVIDVASSGQFENSQIQKVHLIFDTVLSENVRDYLALIEGYESKDDPGFRDIFRAGTLLGTIPHGGM